MDAEVGIVEGTLVKYKRAWLITWDWMGDHAKVDDRFVALLDYRYPSETIKRFVEMVYVNKCLAFHEQLAYAKRRSANPYPAELGTLEIRTSGDSGSPTMAPWGGQIMCGHNPWLFGRMIYDVQAYVDKDGMEHLKWRERLHPALRGGKIVSDWAKGEIRRK